MVDTKMFEDTSTGDAALAGHPGGGGAGVPGPRQPGEAVGEEISCWRWAGEVTSDRS